jgi:hypothetical protein
MPPDGAAASLRLSDKNRIIAASHSVITLFSPMKKPLLQESGFFIF